jgi:hypothetical protein
MRVYSATEAIWPALLRTADYLFNPFQWKRFFKLATVACVSEGVLVGFRFWTSDAFPAAVSLASVEAFLLAPTVLPYAVVGAIALFLATVYGYYFVIRLRFAFFHSLVHQTAKIRAAARLYTADAEIFYSASVIVWLSVLVAAALAVVVYVTVADTLAPPTQVDRLAPGNSLLVWIPCVVIASGFLIAVFTARVVLNDLILPQMAIEGGTLRRAWTRVRVRIAANREMFLSFLLVRLAILVIAGVPVALLAWIAGLGAFGLLDTAQTGVLANVGANGPMPAAVRALFFLPGLGLGWAIAVVMGGPLSVFLRSYSLFFYGSHFKALGNLLEPDLSVPVHVQAAAESDPAPARLGHDRLEAARLEKARLEEAKLEKARLERATPERATLEEKRVKNGGLENGRLENAPLETAPLENARLEKARPEQPRLGQGR